MKISINDIRKAVNTDGPEIVTDLIIEKLEEMEANLERINKTIDARVGWYIDSLDGERND